MLTVNLLLSRPERGIRATAGVSRQADRQGFFPNGRYHLKLWIGVLDESAAYLPA